MEPRKISKPTLILAGTFIGAVAGMVAAMRIADSAETDSDDNVMLSGNDIGKLAVTLVTAVRGASKLL